MKRLSMMDGKAVLLAQTGLVLIFALSGIKAAAAQTAPVSIDSGIPGAPAVPATSTTTTTTTTTSAAPASTTPGASAKATTTMPATTPVAQETLPVASKTEAASQPSAAELAIVQNGAKMNTPAPVAAQGTGQQQGQGTGGLRVTDILSTPANIRPLPKDYLIVKKEHSANDTDSRLTAARMALWQGHYQAALELFDDLYRKNKRDIRFSMGRAVALQKLGQTDEAMEAYQVALTNDPHNIEALTNMLGLLKGKDAPTALRKLQQLRELYPANADVTAQLGMVYGVSGDYTNALKYLNMADALKPGSATVLYNKAVAYDRMGNTAEAADLYRKIVLLASDGSLEQNFPIEVVRQRLATIR